MMTKQSYRDWHQLSPWRRSSSSSSSSNSSLMVAVVVLVMMCLSLQSSLAFTPLAAPSQQVLLSVHLISPYRYSDTRMFAVQDRPLPPNQGLHTKKREVKMQLLPISKNILRDIVPRRVNTEQWKSYWGTTPFEKVQKMMESVLVAYGGAWLAWFVSFMSGGPLAAFVGTALIFNWIFSPYVISRRNNQRFWFDGKGKPLHHAIFIAKIIRYY